MEKLHHDLKSKCGDYGGGFTCHMSFLSERPVFGAMSRATKDEPVPRDHTSFLIFVVMCGVVTGFEYWPFRS